MAEAVAAGHGWEVVVLSGGRGSRLGGVVKADVEIDGRRLLERLLAGLPAPVAVTVAGPPSQVARANVTFCREEPPFAGPVAGLAAALAHVNASVVVLLGGDMPDAGVLAAVLAEAAHTTDADAVVAVADSRRQPLCGAYRLDALRSALAVFDADGGVANRSMRELLDALAVEELLPSERFRSLMTDIDTEDDLARARARHAEEEDANAR